MELTVFASRKHTSDGGKPFTVYSTKLVNRTTNTEDYVQVRFVGTMELKNCPCIIKVEKRDANISKRTWIDKDGVTRETLVLWIKNYTLSDKEYIDHSLDNYEFD